MKGGGPIYALSSGMMTEHTVSNRFAWRILESEENALLFVGYADEETPAGRILEAGRGGAVRLDEKRAEETPIRCQVERFDFSGHAPRDQLADYAVSVDPSTVLLVHGDPPARGWFQEELQKRLPRAHVVAAQPSQRIDL